MNVGAVEALTQNAMVANGTSRHSLLQRFGRYQTNNGQISILTGNGYDAIDP